MRWWGILNFKGVLALLVLLSSGLCRASLKAMLRWRPAGFLEPRLVNYRPHRRQMMAKAVTSGMNKLMIVESPAKAKTIEKYLKEMGQSVTVKSSMGHIRDLVKKKSEVSKEIAEKMKGGVMGVDVNNDFTPYYIINPNRQSVVDELLKASSKCSEVILATDEDREGEAISWHLLQVLQPKVPSKRATFTEITKEAIERSLQNPRDIDDRLVVSQETRRILDRLTGFTLSPMLWKFGMGPSAGRVQSAGLAIICNKEMERLQFKSSSFYSVSVQCSSPSSNSNFTARVVSVGQSKVATSGDFDDRTGSLKAGKTVVLLTQKSAGYIVDWLQNNASNANVSDVEKRTITRKAPLPFITSTLQQEASSKLGISPNALMGLAQSLYEKGYITYTRTDKPVMSESAQAIGRQIATQIYGSHSLRTGKQNAARGKHSQEAHEAIRPAEINGRFLQPAEVNVAPAAQAVYTLIYKRAIASTMADAIIESLTYDILITGTGTKIDENSFSSVRMRTSGSSVVFPGWMLAYDNGDDDTENGNLPNLGQGDHVDLHRTGISATEQKTRPPVRFTEGSFVKELDVLGIGRPSTYGSITSTLVARGYIRLKGQTIIPTISGISTNSLISRLFPDLVNASFTANMETYLDLIAQGEGDKVTFLETFYKGDKGLRERAANGVNATILDEVRTIHLPALNGTPYRLGVNGKRMFLTNTEDSTRVFLSSELVPDLESITPTTAAQLFKHSCDEGVMIGSHEGKPVLLRFGKFGPYLQRGSKDDEDKKRIAINKAILNKTVSTYLSLEDAVALLALPRVVGVHPELNEEVKLCASGKGLYISVGHRMSRKYLKEQFPRNLSYQEIMQKVPTADELAASEGRLLGSIDGLPVTCVDKPRYSLIRHNNRQVVVSRRKDQTVTLEDAETALFESKGKSPKKTKAKTEAKTTADKKQDKKTTSSGTSDKQTKRMPNAYAMFLSECSKQARLAGGKTPTMQEVSIMWKALSDEEKANFKSAHTHAEEIAKPEPTRRRPGAYAMFVAERSKEARESGANPPTLKMVAESWGALRPEAKLQYQTTQPDLSMDEHTHTDTDTPAKPKKQAGAYANFVSELSKRARLDGTKVSLKEIAVRWKELPDETKLLYKRGVQGLTI